MLEAEAPVVPVLLLLLTQTMESSTIKDFTPSSYTCTQEHLWVAFSNSTKTCKTTSRIGIIAIHCQVSYHFKLCSIGLLLLKEVSRERSKICMDIVMQIILIMGGHTFTKLLNISNVIKHIVNCDVFTQQIRQKI